MMQNEASEDIPTAKVVGVETGTKPVVEVMQVSPPANTDGAEEDYTRHVQEQNGGALFHPEASDLMKQQHNFSMSFSCMCIMLGQGKKDNTRWVPDRHMTAIAIMGGVCLNFSNAEFIHKDIFISCFSLMGGVTVIVPPGVRIVDHGLAICGGFHGPEEDYPYGSVLDMPTIHLRGVAIMGGVSGDFNANAKRIQIVRAEP